jgi:hypothetical protein
MRASAEAMNPLATTVPQTRLAEPEDVAAAVAT